MPVATDDDVARAATSLLAKVAPATLLVTRGAAGMTLVRWNGTPIHVGTPARVVFDVTDAGDTIVSAMALGLATHFPLPPLLDLANRAAGAVVSRIGTAVLAIDELLAALPE